MYLLSSQGACQCSEVVYLGKTQVYIVGEVGIVEELELKGIQHCGGPDDVDKKVQLSPGYAMPHDESVCCSSS